MAVSSTEWIKISKMIADAINANNIAPVILKNKSISGTENTLFNLKMSFFSGDATEEFDTKQVIPTPTPTPSLVSAQLETAWTEGLVTIIKSSLTPEYTLTAGIGQYGGLLRFKGGYSFQSKVYTLSALVKKINWDYIGFRIDGGTLNDVYPFVNLSTLAVNTLNVPGVTLKAVAETGGIRITYTFTPTVGIKTMDIAMVGADGISYYNFAGTEKVFISNVSLT